MKQFEFETSKGRFVLVDNNQDDESVIDFLKKVDYGSYTKEECGNFTKRLEVVYFGYAKWSIKENEQLTHWMIVLPPDRTVTLL